MRVLTGALTLLLLGADPWLIRFEGFTSAQEARADLLDKLFRGQLESMADEPKAAFNVLDEGHVDVVLTATQAVEDKELVFHWYISTSSCPAWNLDYAMRRPRKKLDKGSAREILKDVLVQVDLVRQGKAGKKSPNCTEDGDAYPDMPSNTAEPERKKKK